MLEKVRAEAEIALLALAHLDVDRDLAVCVERVGLGNGDAVEHAETASRSRASSISSGE